MGAINKTSYNERKNGVDWIFFVLSLILIGTGFWIFLTDSPTKIIEAIFFLLPGFCLLSIYIFVSVRTDLKATIIVGVITSCAGIGATLWVGNYSTNEIQEALYPNRFKVRTDIQNIESEDHEWADQTRLISPSRVKPNETSFIPYHQLSAESRNMLLRITINNQSKYPANMVPITVYIGEGDFKEDIKSIVDVIKLWSPYSVLYEPSPIKTGEGKLKGIRFTIDQIQPKDKLYLFFLRLTMKKATGHFVVVVRNNIYGFIINLNEQLKMRDDKD